MLGIHRYSYHKRGYRILSESSSLLSENSLAIQNLVSRSRNEISRADLINITPRSIPRRSVDACTHASIAQTGEYRLPRACITRATRATCNRPFRAPSTPRSDTVIDPGIDRSIARPCDKGTERVASVANLDRYPASTNLSFVRVCPLDYYMTALQQYWLALNDSLPLAGILLVCFKAWSSQRVQDGWISKFKLFHNTWSSKFARIIYSVYFSKF